MSQNSTIIPLYDDEIAKLEGITDEFYTIVVGLSNMQNKITANASKLEQAILTSSNQTQWFNNIKAASSANLLPPM